MSNLIKLLLILSFVALATPTEEEYSDSSRDQDDDEGEQIPDVQHFSFLLEAIDEYDPAGKGFIRKQDYGDFLFKVITKGSVQEGVEVTQVEALKLATKEFSQLKQGDEVGIQNFYEDLVTGFYKFLSDKSKYEKLRNELYENQVPDAKEDIPLDSLIVDKEEQTDDGQENTANQGEQL